MKQIHRGWSYDTKYLLTNIVEQIKLLRVSDISYLEEKKNDFSAKKIRGVTSSYI